jgi:hypothetical protein
MKVDIELDIRRKTFASRLLRDLIAVLRRSRPEFWRPIAATRTVR